MFVCCARAGARAWRAAASREEGSELRGHRCGAAHTPVSCQAPAPAPPHAAALATPALPSHALTLGGSEQAPRPLQGGCANSGVGQGAAAAEGRQLTRTRYRSTALRGSMSMLPTVTYLSVCYCV